MSRTKSGLEPNLGLLQNAGFRRLLESRLAGQTATNAMIYAVLILLVKEHGSSLHATLLIVALSLPSIVLGIPAGTLADILPRRFTMTAGYLTRAGIATALVAYNGHAGFIFSRRTALLQSGQLFGWRKRCDSGRPAQTVAGERGARIVLAQIAGMVVLAPFLIKLRSRRGFAVSAALFLAGVHRGLAGTGFSSGASGRRHWFHQATREGFRILRTNRAYLRWPTS
jgi:hypothetical protein